MNTQVIYSKIPSGLPDPKQTFTVKKVPFDKEKAVVPPGYLLVRTLYLSVDPYMRARMRSPEVKSYFPAAMVDTPFMGGAVVEVIRSGEPKFQPGQVLVTFSPWEEYAIIPAVSPIGSIVVIPNPRESKVPLSYYLGVLGMPGLTAYAGMTKFCAPLTPGQTLYVSAASGAVGQVVGQYAKALGIRVVGSAGSDDKVAYLKELGFDEAFNYKKHTDFTSILRSTCPNGIDIYFENVGGKMLEAVLEVANDFCRIAVCGMISQYNRTENPEGIHNMFQIISKRIKMAGFIVSDHVGECAHAAVPTFAKLLTEGRMKYKETVTVGIEKAPQAFVDMLEGKNFGKAIVKVADL